jgi:large subunit ribosomal protein L13
MKIKTYSPKASEIERRWWLVDAQGQTLGRLASVVATKLRGKDKPMYAPHMDCGDFVVVINASQIEVTGRKLEQKQYHYHSGYPGGLRTTNLAKEMEKHSDRVIEKAVRGMLPKTALGDHIIKKLKVYAGAEHPHISQQPQPWALTEDLTGRAAS